MKPWLAKFRLVLHSKKFSVLRAAPISLVGQAIRLSPPAGAGVWLRLCCFVGQLGKLRADGIGALRVAQVSDLANEGCWVNEVTMQHCIQVRKAILCLYDMEENWLRLVF